MPKEFCAATLTRHGRVSAFPRGQHVVYAGFRVPYPSARGPRNRSRDGPRVPSQARTMQSPLVTGWLCKRRAVHVMVCSRSAFSRTSRDCAAVMLTNDPVSHWSALGTSCFSMQPWCISGLTHLAVRRDRAFVVLIVDRGPHNGNLIDLDYCAHQNLRCQGAGARINTCMSNIVQFSSASSSYWVM